MVEYSLAKAEVEGSSPFFRLGFPSWFRKDGVIVVAGGADRRHQERVARRTRGQVAWLRGRGFKYLEDRSKKRIFYGEMNHLS